MDKSEYITLKQLLFAMSFHIKLQVKVNTVTTTLIECNDYNIIDLNERLKPYLKFTVLYTTVRDNTLIVII